jgi:hypothetical protein
MTTDSKTAIKETQTPAKSGDLGKEKPHKTPDSTGKKKRKRKGKPQPAPLEQGKPAEIKANSPEELALATDTGGGVGFHIVTAVDSVPTAAKEEPKHAKGKKKGKKGKTDKPDSNKEKSSNADKQSDDKPKKKWEPKDKGNKGQDKAKDKDPSDPPKGGDKGGPKPGPIPVPPPSPPVPPKRAPGYDPDVVLLDNGVGFKTTTLYTDLMLKQLLKYTPGFVPVMQPGAVGHTHPISAFERRVCEAVMIRDATSGPRLRIVDIGGNVNRHRRLNRAIWSLSPILTPADAIRVNGWKGPNWCQHTVQQQCVCAGGVPDIYISIHSLYYLNPQDVLDALHFTEKKTIYAAVHRYRLHVGKMCLGEISYRLDGSGMVHSQTEGNASPYTHDCQLWLDTQYYDDGHQAMAWSIIRIIGDTTIYKFAEAPTALQTPPARQNTSVVEALEDVNYRGLVRYQPLTLTNSGEVQLRLEMEQHEPIFSCGTHLIIGKERPFPLPKIFVTQLRMAMTYRTRDKDTFQTCVAITKNLLKKLNIENEHAEQAAIWAPVLAFQDVELQTKLLSGMALNNYWLQPFKAFNTALNLEIPVRWLIARHWKKFLGGAVLISLLCVRYREVIFKYFVKILGTIGLIIISYICKALKIPLPPGSILYPGNLVYNDICYEGAPISKQGAKTSIRVDSTLSECKPRHGATLCGISFAQRMPVQPRSCQHNEVIAVHNRVIMDTNVFYSEEIIKQTWARLRKDFLPEFAKLLTPDHDNNVVEVPFNEWLTRFPLRSRNTFLKAMEEKEVVEDPRYNRRKAFVKREFLLKLDDLGPYDLDPRLIQGAQASYQIDTGPWTLAYSKFLAKKWSMASDSSIIYTSGMTANELGQAFDYAVEYMITNFGSCVTVEDDGKFWDGTQTEEAIKTENDLYAQHKPPAKVMRALKMQEVCVGATPHGVKYRAKGKRKSGDGNTSCGNSQTNASDHTFGIQETSGHTIEEIQFHVLMFVLGDDNLMFTHIEYHKYIVDSVDVLRRLGLQPKMKLNLDYRLSEYCSGWFWPSDTGTVFGPKIGRVLMKNAWSRSAERQPESWSRAVALGLERDTHHIPILRALVKRQIQLTSKVAARPFMENSRYKFKFHASRKSNATTETYELLYLLYGVDQHQVQECERLIGAVERLPARINSPLFDAFFDADIKPRTSINTCNHIPSGVPPVTFPVPGALSGPQPSVGYIAIHVLWEELVKHLPVKKGVHLGFIATLLIVSLELVSAKMLGDLRKDNSFYCYIPTMLMHFATGAMPIGPAITIHMLWNAWAYGLLAPRGGPPPGEVWWHQRFVNVVMRKQATVLDSLVSTRTLTPEGKNWLTQVTDPFHDGSVPTTGYPDLNSCQTIVQCFTYTANLTAPTALTTPTWDAHVFFNPTSYDWNGTGFGMGTLSNTGLLTTSATAVATVYGGYNAIVVTGGEDWTTTTLAARSYSSLGFPSVASAGSFRLVSAGVEVVNTTPQLYRGGSVTSYRSPNVTAPVEWTNIFATNSVSLASTLPPSLVADAQIYPTSRTWGAEDGCYLIAPMSDVENPFKQALPINNLVVRPMDYANLTVPGATTPVAAPFAALGRGSGTRNSCAQIVPFDIHGSMFTGLTPQSTLQVTVKYYVERIPTSTQQDLLVLVRPPSPYDPNALELYTRAVQLLPVAVKVADNPLGEWWDDVLSAISEYAPAIGSVFGPVGATLGSAVKGAASATLAERRKARQQSSPTTNQASVPRNIAPKPSGRKRPRNKKKKAKKQN